MIKNRKGIISVFLALIIMPVYMVSIVSIDLARLYAASNYIKMANFNIVKSSLLKYNKEFFDKYKILSIEEDIDNLEKFGQDLVSLNLDRFEVDNNLINPFDHVLKFEINQEDSLLNTKNLEKQIIETMKYQGPILLADGFMDLLAIAKTSKTYNRALADKMKYHEELDQFNQESEKLSLLLKKYSDGSKDINTLVQNYKSNMKKYFDKNMDIQNLIAIYKPTKLDYSEKTEVQLQDLFNYNYSEDFFKKIIGIVNTYNKDDYNSISKAESFNKIKNQLDIILEICKYKSFDKSLEYDGKKYTLSNTISKIQDFRLEISTLLQKEIYGKDILDQYKKAFERIVTQKETLTHLKKEIYQIKKASESLNISLDEWKSSINSIEDKNLKNQMRTEFEFTNKVFSNENIDAILNQLERDGKSLEILYKNLNYNSQLSSISMIKNLNKSGFDTDDYKNLDKVNPINSLESYAIFKRFVLKVEADASPQTLNKEEAKKSRDKLLEFNKDNNRQINKTSNILDFTSQDNINKILGYEFKTNIIDNSSYADISFDSKDSITAYLDKANEELTFGTDITSMLDNLLIAQYISDIFNGKLLNKDGDFVSQKEYILFGDQSLNKNVSKVNSLIFGIRLGLNSIYAYTSPQIQMETLQIATAIGGGTLIGIPILQNILIFGLGFGESLIDMTKINASKEVETFKNQSSWQLSLTGLTNLSIESASQIAKDSIENIYDNAEEIAMDIIEGSEDKLNSYINQSIDSISQEISSAVIIPLQNKLISLISDPVTDIKGELTSFFDDLEVLIKQDENEITRGLKLEMLNFVETNYFNKLFQIIDNYTSLTNSILIDTFNEIKQKTETNIKVQISHYGQDLRREISSKLSTSKEGVKDKVSESIEKYLSKFSTNDSKSSSNIANSLLSFSYDDYLKLMIFLGLNTYKKDDMLKRMLVVMDIEMKKISQDFSIINQYVAIASTLESNILSFSGIIDTSEGRIKLDEKIKMGY